MARRFRLESRWRLPAPPDECWRVLADPGMSWPLWWPGVRALDVRPSPTTVGSAGTLEFRAPGGYPLRVHLVVTEADPPRHVTFEADGDLRGDAHATLRAAPASTTTLDVVWDVVPTRGPLRALAPVLRPAFVASHAAVMRAGEAGLAAHLRAGGRT